MPQIKILTVASPRLQLLMTYGSILKKYLSISTHCTFINYGACLLRKETDMSIIEYYTQFKSIFDELYELQLLLEDSCGASKILTQREEDQRVHLFF